MVPLVKIGDLTVPEFIIELADHLEQYHTEFVGRDFSKDDIKTLAKELWDGIDTLRLAVIEAFLQDIKPRAQIASVGSALRVIIERRDVLTLAAAG